jgi:bifunctional non-homologous end joining protein LigD
MEESPEKLCPECRFGPLPAHLDPMLAVLSSMPEDPDNWAFEYKWDGMRALCYWQNGQMRLESRNLNDITGRYPDLLARTDQMPPEQMILDGEIVALDPQGRPSFPLLQKRMHVSPGKARQAARQVQVWYYVFDLLWLKDGSLVDEPYHARREKLEALGFQHEKWRVPPSHIGQGQAMMQVARDHKLEGLIAKKPDGPYRINQRSRDWRKIKIVRRQEFVIGGWEPRKENSSQVGSLLLGYYSPGSAGLVYAGKVGSGFDAQTHRLLVEKLGPLARDQSPFAERPGHSEARYVHPRLVAEVAYRRWPKRQTIHQASFLGLRSDVPPDQVRLEREK